LPNKPTIPAAPFDLPAARKIYYAVAVPIQRLGRDELTHELDALVHSGCLVLRHGLKA
jgi:hypothetical protein